MKDALLIVAIAISVVILWYTMFRLDTYSNYERAQEIISKGKSYIASGSYQGFRDNVRGDPVEYKTAKKLYREGQLTPERLASEL